MKKTLFLIMFLSAVISSCKKDDNNPTPADLTGTTWISDDTANKIEFISNVQVKYTWKYLYDGGIDVQNGMYSITGNKIAIDFGNDSMNGTIESNSMTFVYSSEVFIVKKQ